MKLKNIIQIGSFVVAGVAPMTSSTASASDYMCLACPAGTYSETAGATSCTKCPAGYTSIIGSTSKSDCTPCPAGTYSEGGTKCLPCPDYHWSNEGSGQCGRVQIGFNFLQLWNPAEGSVTARELKWYNAGTTFTCNKRQGIKILSGDQLMCGSACWNAPQSTRKAPGHVYTNYPQCGLLYGETDDDAKGTSIFLGCKGFPCELSMQVGDNYGMNAVAYNGTKVTLNSDGSYSFTDKNGNVQKDKLPVKW